MLAAIVLVGLAGRLVWIASRTETGWETIAADWHAATIGRFVGHRLPVAQRDQTAQTEFWLAEIDRVLAREPHTPELLLGAVRMLGTYNGDYNLPISAELVAVPDVNSYDGTKDRGSDAASRQRRAKQLQLAGQATTEFPMSPSTWQTLAEIVSLNFGSDESSPESLDWRKVLENCEAHDPGNSLYEFLAAHRLLNEANQIAGSDEYAARSGNPPANEVLRELRDKEIELETTAIQHIERGLGMAKFEVAHDKTPLYKFIDSVSLPRVEKAHLAAWCDAGFFYVTGVVQSLNECIPRMESRAPGTDTTAVRRLALQLYELNPEVPIGDPVRRMQYAALRSFQWKQWADYLERDLNAQPPDEAVEARKKAIDLEVQSRQWNSLFSRWARQAGPQFNNTWIGYAAWKAAALAVQLFLITCIAVALRQILRLAIPACRIESEARLSVLRQLAAWFAALMASVMTFALAPAGIISHAMQGWVVLVVFVIAIIGLPIAVAIALKGRISIWTLLAFTISYTLIFTGLSLCDTTDINRPLRKLPPAVWIPPRGTGDFSAEWLEAKINRATANRQRSPSVLRWPALQWILYHGAEWTIAGALIGIGIWWWMRANRERKRAAMAAGTSVNRRASLIPSLFRALARSALGSRHRRVVDLFRIGTGADRAFRGHLSVRISTSS